MTISRVNQTGWFRTSTLTSNEINQLDTNITYGLDKRNGETDTISSDITINSSGSLTFEAGASLLFNDAADLIISDGYLSIDCIVLGKTKPLRTGFIECPVGGLANYAMTSTYYVNNIIKLTGELDSDLLITMPAIAGYSKIIDNSCTSTAGTSYRVSIKTVSGALYKAVYLPNGKCSTIYCDGIDIILGPSNTSNNVLSIQSMADKSSNYGSTVQTITNTNASPEQVVIDNDVYFVFNNVQVGDLFEITYTVGLLSTDGHFVATKVETSEAPGLYETELRCYGAVQKTSTISTIYTCLYAASTIAFYLTAFCDGTTGYIKNPISMVVKHIRP